MRLNELQGATHKFMIITPFSGERSFFEGFCYELLDPKAFDGLGQIGASCIMDSIVTVISSSILSDEELSELPSFKLSHLWDACIKDGDPIRSASDFVKSLDNDFDDVASVSPVIAYHYQSQLEAL